MVDIAQQAQLQKGNDLLKAQNKILERIAMALEDVADAYLAGLGKQRRKQPF